MRSLLFLGLFAFLYIYSAKARANLEFEDAVFPELVTSARALAMGNAYICKTDDADAPMYNPAGLGTVRLTHFHLSNFSVELNKSWMSAYTGGNISRVMGSVSKVSSFDGTRQVLLENKGLIAQSRLQAMPNFTTRYFAIGYIYSKASKATIGTATGDNFEYAVRQDMGPYGALNLSLFGGIVKFGVTGSYITRTEAIGNAPQANTINLTDSDYKRGKAFLITSGARITLPWSGLPTIAATIHNSIDKDFTQELSGKPTKMNKNIVIGASITPQLGQRLRVHLEANLKDATSSYSGVSFNRKIGLGLELDIARAMYFRLGYGDGFGSAGVGLRTQKLQFDLTTYAVDTTATAFRGQEDRRFSMMLSSGF